MARKTRGLLMLVLVLVAAFAVCAVTACSGGAKYAITWNVSEHATVTVAEYEGLPAEVKEETSLIFRVVPEKGYDVASVRVNDRTVTADKNGNYSVVVKADMLIEVETVEQVSAVTVKTKPSQLVYYAGEELDTAGMVVEVEYGSGRKAEETDYTVVYENGGAFALGDTSFSVKFKGISSAKVDLAAAVEVKVEVDPAGGQIADDYLTALQANTELKNVTRAENGVISFTYSALTANVALPAAEQWSRGEEGDYVFVSWGNDGATELSKDNVTSIRFTANYKPLLLELTSIRYENQTVGDELIPYLIISGNFRAAKTAYLYLYEGNSDVELVGDTVGGETTERGDEFELKFDLRKLVEAGYLGKWMDIKFVAGEGDAKETQEIWLDDYPEDFVDVEQIIVNGDHSFSFAVWDDNGNIAPCLKAVYNNYFMNEYTMSASKDADGNAVLTIAGKVAEKWAGKSVCIDFTECVDGGDVQYAVIGADGSYTLSFNFKEYKLNTNGYAHFRIVESEEQSSTVLYKDGEGNLLNAGCLNTDLTSMSIGLIENQGALRVPNGDETAVFYVGKGKWGGIVLYGKNEAIATERVTLEVKDGKPCLVVVGSYKDFTVEDVIAYLTQSLYADIRNNADGSSGSVNTEWVDPTVLSLGKEAQGEETAVPATIFVTAADGVWKIYLDLSARENAVGEVLFSHFSLSGNTQENLVSDSIDTVAKIRVTVGETEVQYRLGVFTVWGTKLVSVYVEEADEEAEDEGVFVMAGWGRFISEEKFNNYVQGFKAYLDENGIEYTSVSGTYYADDKYYMILDFTSKIVADNNVDVIVACADNISTQENSQVKDMVVEKKSIEIKDQTGRMVATLNRCALNEAFLAFVETDAAKAILAA